MTVNTLPLVSIAAFCDRVLQEVDGTISLIRVIDRITLQGIEGHTPDEMPPMFVNANAVLALKSGPVEGERELTLQIRNPDGSLGEQKEPVPLVFYGSNQGMNLVFGLGFEVRAQGVYWVDVLIDGDTLTSMPLEVLYQQVPFEPGQTAPEPA